jgi:hypothetical protein
VTLAEAQRATVAVAALAAAMPTACDSGDQDGPAPARTPIGNTTTIRMGGDGKYADIQTGTLTAKTTYVWEIEIGGGRTLRCVRDLDTNYEVTYEHCSKIRSTYGRTPRTAPLRGE